MHGQTTLMVSVVQ